MQGEPNDRAASLEIRSLADTTRLLLRRFRSQLIDACEECALDVSLASTACTASLQVCDYQFQHWPAFFENLAENSGGWQGERCIASAEGHLAVVARIALLRHVFLHVKLRDPLAVARWYIETTLIAEAGQLDELSKRAHRFFQPSLSR